MSELERHVDAAIRQALDGAATAYAAHGIRVMTDLRASVRLETHDDVLEAALLTLFRALPQRLARDSQLEIRTLDMAGGDIELKVDGEWLPRSERGHSDLVELALDGLASLCRARYGRVEIEEREDESGRRRILFVIPSLAREAGWHPRG